MEVIRLHLPFTFRLQDGKKSLNLFNSLREKVFNFLSSPWAVLWPTRARRSRHPAESSTTDVTATLGLYLVISAHVNNQQISTWTATDNSTLMWGVYFLFWFLKLDYLYWWERCPHSHHDMSVTIQVGSLHLLMFLKGWGAKLFSDWIWQRRSWCRSHSEHAQVSAGNSRQVSGRY